MSSRVIDACHGVPVARLTYHDTAARDRLKAMCAFKPRWDGANKVWNLTDCNAGQVRVWADAFKATITEAGELALSRLDNPIPTPKQPISAAPAVSEGEQKKLLAALGAAVHLPQLPQLRVYQRELVGWVKAEKRVYVGDDMGTGKTLGSLAAAEYVEAWPVLVVAPLSLLVNWRNEVRHWLPNRTAAIVTTKTTKLPDTDVVIVNYDIISRILPLLSGKAWRFVVADEAHYAKSWEARRTKALHALMKGAEYRVLMSGTPVLNRPAELVSPLRLLDRLDRFGGWETFVTRYCGAYQSRFGWDVSGASNLDELNARLRGGGGYIRRTKADVLSELPGKTRSYVTVALSNEASYRKAEASLIEWLKERAVADKEFTASLAGLSEEEKRHRRQERANSAAAKALRAEQLVRLSTLKRLAASGKVAAVKEWLSDSFDNTSEKVLIFAHHQEVCNELAEALGCEQITGSTPGPRRAETVSRFQDPAGPQFLVGNQAMAVGLNLTAATHVVFLECWWTPAIHDQAEDRANRLGQVNLVTCHYLVGDGTIDEELLSVLERKAAVVAAVLDGGTPKDDVDVADAVARRLVRKAA